jgi:hypothetical protein
MADGQTLSLRDQLQADYDTLSGAPEPTPAPEPVIEGTATLVAEANAEQPAAEAAPAATGSPDRDEHGRFKPKAETPPAETGATAQPQAPESVELAQPEPQSEAIRVPPSLPAAVKAKFASLDPDVQQGFVALESSVQKAKAEWEGKGQRLNRYDEIIGPQLDRWRMNGLDEYSGVQSLIAAQSLLDRDPLGGIAQIARSYGLTPAHIAHAFGLSQTSAPAPAADGTSPATANPDFQAALHAAVAPLQQGFQTLQQQLQQSQQAEQAAKIATAQREIEAFSADPANMYFDNVSDAVVALIAQDRQNGGSMSLKDAYDRAVWADPTIRPHLQQAEITARAAEEARKAGEAKAAAEKAAQQKAQAANRAAGSVTGSPTPGAGPPAGASRPLREELAANYQASLQQL